MLGAAIGCGSEVAVVEPLHAAAIRIPKSASRTRAAYFETCCPAMKPQVMPRTFDSPDW